MRPGNTVVMWRIIKGTAYLSALPHMGHGVGGASATRPSSSSSSSPKKPLILCGNLQGMNNLREYSPVVAGGTTLSRRTAYNGPTPRLHTYSFRRRKATTQASRRTLSRQKKVIKWFKTPTNLLGFTSLPLLHQNHFSYNTRKTCSKTQQLP